MRPSRMTTTRSDMPRISGSSDETMMTARPSRDELGHEAVHGGLGADVDALGRLVEDDDLAAAVASHLAITTFCWLPPESVADILAERCGAQVEPLGVRAGERELLGQAQEAGARGAVRARAA